MIDALVSPGALIGCLLGLVVALLFHWLAPAGTDTASAAAWFIGLGCVLGLVAQAVFEKRRD